MKLIASIPTAPASELVTSYEWKIWRNGALQNPTTSTSGPSLEIQDPSGTYMFSVRKVNFVGLSGESATVSSPSVPSTPPAPTLTVEA